jgi:hypothetical protein
MSIKRTKQRTFGRGREGEENAFGGPKATAPEKTWAESVEGKDDSAFAAYSMTAKFAKGALLAHPKFGKGVVLDVEPTRIEVLFEDGTKKLGHAG